MKMKAITLVKYGNPQEAFEVRETKIPEIDDDQVLIKVDAFGLNYADVMARNGIYPDAEKNPTVLGYECVGRVEKKGASVDHVEVGDRVLAFTRFGSYAEYAKTNHLGVIRINDTISNGDAVALATQYVTAWYSACEMMNLHEGDRVLVHAAAGGVGTALVQICKHLGCEVFGTASKPEKIQYLKDIGADHPINYAEKDFVKAVKKITKGDRMDAIFDPIGGSNFKRSLKVLNYGGRIVIFGASSRGKKGLGSLLKLGLGFGLHSPAPLIMKSQSWIGVNMLRVADHKPKPSEPALMPSGICTRKA
jgi:NADPH:quinone reductase-like Zn-dependent oxidoreductase